MAMNDTFGEPIPRGIIGDSAPIEDRTYGEAPPRASQAAEIAEIRRELRQLSRSLGQLAETTGRLTQQSVRNAAYTAVDRYPLGSLVFSALVGYWLAGRR